MIALDVGHGQFAPEIAADARVRVIEGFNARFMTSGLGDAAAGQAVRASLVVADLAIISLPLVLPALVGTVGLEADFVLLVKPQFEVGRTGIREGIVWQGPLRTDAVNVVLWAARDLGLRTAGVIPVTNRQEHGDIVAHAPDLAGIKALGDGIDLGDLELVIVLGGAGIILRTAELVRGSSVALLGVNLGHVGFLA